MWFSLRKSTDWGHKGGFQSAAAPGGISSGDLGDSYVYVLFVSELHT